MTREGTIPEDVARMMFPQFYEDVDKPVDTRSVEDKMGRVELIFVWVNATRTRFMFANQKTSWPMHRVWNPVKSDFPPNGEYFAVLVRHKAVTNGKSNASFVPMAVLAWVDSQQSLQRLSHLHWNLIGKEQGSLLKAKAALRFSTEILKECQECLGYNEEAERMLQICSEGGLKEIIEYLKQAKEQK